MMEFLTSCYQWVAENYNKNANDINDLAQTILNNAKKRIEISKAASGKGLEVLGEKKIHILDNKINEFIRLFEKIQNITLNESSGLNELSKLANYEEYNSNIVTMLMWNHYYEISYELFDHYAVILVKYPK